MILKNDAFPLSLCGHNDRLEHIIEFKLALRDLILIRNSDGEVVEFDMNYLDMVNMTFS